MWQFGRFQGHMLSLNDLPADDCGYTTSTSSRSTVLATQGASKCESYVIINPSKFSRILPPEFQVLAQHTPHKFTSQRLNFSRALTTTKEKKSSTYAPET